MFLGLVCVPVQVVLRSRHKALLRESQAILGPLGTAWLTEL